jgi:hypothetical protein
MEHSRRELPTQEEESMSDEITDQTIIRALIGQDTYPEPRVGDLRVWWIPQVPMRPFFVPVENAQEGKLILKVLAAYDLFQLRHKVKPDFCNTGGLEIFEDDEWCDWYCTKCGEEIDRCYCQCE